MFVTDDYYNDAEAGKDMLRKKYYKNRKKVNYELTAYCNTLVGYSEKTKEYFFEKFEWGTLYPIQQMFI